MEYLPSDFYHARLMVGRFSTTLEKLRLEMGQFVVS